MPTANNGRCGSRTCDPLIKSQQTKISKSNNNSNLQNNQTSTIVPAYRRNQKNKTILPTDLAEIVIAWDKLPEVIRSAIMAIVRSSISR
jgi:hypothetical protein